MDCAINRSYVSLSRNTDRILCKLDNLYQEGKFADFEFTCGPQNETVKAHGIILLLCSPLIEQMFQVRQQLVSESKLTLSTVNKNMLQYILELIYKGKVNVPVNELSEFYTALNLLKMSDILLENRIEPTVVMSGEQVCDEYNQENDTSGNVPNCAKDEIEKNGCEQVVSKTENDQQTSNIRKAITENVGNDSLSLQPSTSKDTGSALRMNPFADPTFRSKVFRKKIKASETSPDKISSKRINKSPSLEVEKIFDSSKDSKNSLKVNQDDYNVDESKTKTNPNKTIEKCSHKGTVVIEDSDSTDSDIVPISIKKPKHFNNSSDKEKQERLEKREKKYTKLFSMSDFQFKKYFVFCIICNKKYRNIKEHIKDNHRIMPRSADLRCKHCSQKFYANKVMEYHIKHICEKKSCE